MFFYDSSGSPKGPEQFDAAIAIGVSARVLMRRLLCAAVCSPSMRRPTELYWYIPKRTPRPWQRAFVWAFASLNVWNELRIAILPRGLCTCFHAGLGSCRGLRPYVCFPPRVSHKNGDAWGRLRELWDVWGLAQMSKQIETTYQVKTQVLIPNEKHQRQVNIFNRTIVRSQRAGIGR